MTLAIIEIGGRLAARIDSAGNVEIIEQSARLAELVAALKLMMTFPGRLGMTRVTSAVASLARHEPEVTLLVKEEDLITGDLVGG